MTNKRAPKAPSFVAEGPPPSRSYRATQIEWGLVSLNVTIYGAISDQNSHRSMWVLGDDKKYHSVGKQSYNKTTGNRVEDADVVKGIEHEGKLVMITDDELRLATEYGQSQLIGFIDQRVLLDNPEIVASNLYQVRPSQQKIGSARRVNQQAEELFAKILNRLEANQKFAVLDLVLTDGAGKKRGLLDHHGNLKLLVPQERVRQLRPLYEAEIKDDEAKLIDQLMKRGNLAALPPYKDDSAAQLQKLVELKAQGKALPTATTQIKQTEDQGDLVAQLKAMSKQT